MGLERVFLIEMSVVRASVVFSGFVGLLELERWLGRRCDPAENDSAGIASLVESEEMNKSEPLLGMSARRTCLAASIAVASLRNASRVRREE